MSIFTINRDLYHIMTELNQLHSDYEDELITDEKYAIELERLYVQYNKLSISLQDKIIGVAKAKLKYESDVATIKAEIKRLEKLKKSSELKAAFLDHILLDNVHDGFQSPDPSVRISRRYYESVQIHNESLIPEQFIRVKQSREPDKIAIKKAIKDGNLISGCDIMKYPKIHIK